MVSKQILKLIHINLYTKICLLYHNNLFIYFTQPFLKTFHIKISILYYILLKKLKFSQIISLSSSTKSPSLMPNEHKKIKRSQLKAQCNTQTKPIHFIINPSKPQSSQISNIQIKSNPKQIPKSNIKNKIKNKKTCTRAHTHTSQFPKSLSC